MRELTDRIKTIGDKHPRPRNPKEYISTWIEKDVLDEEIVDAFVLILRTRGCAWALKSGCSMCGYLNDAQKKKVEEKDLLLQFENAMKQYSNEKIVKIYTSGSFFDEEEVPKNVQDKILKKLAEKSKKIIVETRPEFVTRKGLEGIENLEVALGLESANDFVLENSINKGFKLKDYIKAASILKDLGIGVKTYLLVKPPFLSEREAILDAVNSAKTVADYTQTISFNPVNVQRFTLVEKLWRNGEYRTPWLWSVVEVLRQSRTLKGLRIMSSPTAGGTKKGPFNCGKCDKEVLKAIEEFSLTQDISYLDAPDCECKNLWEDILNIECFTKTQGDLLKLI